MQVDNTKLGRDQQRVLQAVYDTFREANVWPAFGQIDRKLDRVYGIDVAKVIHSIPNDFLRPLCRPGMTINPDLRMELTIRGVSACTDSANDVSLFVRAVRWMAGRERSFRRESTAPTSALTVTDKELMRAFRIPKREAAAVRRLGALLLIEQWGWVHGGPSQDGLSWSFTLRREVRSFRSIRTIDDYLNVCQLLKDENNANEEVITQLTNFTGEPAIADAKGPASSYIDAKIIKAIEEKRTTASWSVDKLLHLMIELNDNYARENVYSTHALLRAILDHVPPLFGLHDFKQVADNYSWSRTDKMYIRKLNEFKTQAHDALHRPITKRSVSPLEMHDLPMRRYINRLFEECLTRL